MPTSISSLLKDSSLSTSLQIKSAENGGIKADGTKASGFFGRIAQGFQRLFNREIQQRNRDGIEAYLGQLHDHDPDLEQAARAALKWRLDSGKPLTLRKIREIGSGVLARSAEEKADALLTRLHTSTTQLLTEEDYSQLRQAKAALDLVKDHLPETQRATLNGLHETSRAINNRINLYEQRIGERRGEGGFLS
jgi:hypothetical protein